jgi:hypothetical protein
MSMQIYAFDKEKIPLDDITLANPQGLQGGAYFSKLKLFGNSVTIQTPRCKTKNGIVKTEKKTYCDLMFDKDDDNVVDFLESIEDTVKNLIYEKKDKWFHTDMDMDTIDYHWQNILRSYKGTNILLRCFIKRPKSRLNSQPTIQIYDEDETLLKIEDITKDKTIMGLLEITGLKFTSQSFSLEFNLTQAMVLKEKVFRNKCLIKPVSASEQTAEPTTNNVILNTEELQSNTVDNSDDNSDVVENDVEVENNNTDEISDHDSSNNIEEAVKDVSIEQVQPEVEDNKLKLVNEHSIEEDIEEVVSNTSDSLQEDAMDVTDDNNAESLAKSEDQMTEPETVDNESLIINTEPLEKNTELSEINLVMPEDKETVQLKKPDEVYLEIYKEVKRRAKEAKKRAIEAYLEAKRIKSLYLLDEIESSDDESELLEMTVN